MTRKHHILLDIIIMVMMVGLSSTSYAQSPDLTKFKGPYLGQSPPGKSPELFAPGLVSTQDGHEFGITISNDGNEIYFTRRFPGEIGNRIYSYKNDNGNWKLKSPPLFGWVGMEMEPNFSPDENRIYFVSRRPVPDEVPDNGFVVTWYSDKIGSNWSEPKIIGSPVLDVGTMFLTQSSRGSRFFTGKVPGQEDGQGIHMSKTNGDDFEPPVYLPEVINGFNNAGHPYVAPDESYMIFDYNIESGNAEKNMMISFKSNDSWSKPINISKYIENADALTAFVSFDGKYLFYCSGSNIYWVDASFIEELRPKN